MLVGLMALACGLALWTTLQQVRVLGQPNEHGDLWHMANVNSELARVHLLAQQLTDGTADSGELRVRLDVLSSVLDGSTRLPQVRERLQQRVPSAATTLAELSEAVAAWGQLLDSGHTGDDRLAAGQIMRQAPALHQRARQAMADVHVATSEDNDLSRQQLHQRFLVLSTVLACLLAGTGALIWQLVKDIRLAREASRTLTLTNQMLEARVLERTRKIEENRLLLNFILDASPSEVLLIDAETSTVIFINQRLLGRLGLHRQPDALRLHDLLPDHTQAQALLDELDRYGEVQAMEALLGQGTPGWSSLSARLIEVDGRLAYLLWGFDISTHKQLEARLRELAATDPLSGLDNRRAFMDKGSALLEHCRRHRQNCTVLMLDIDRFKSINDRFGHQTGDTAIVAFAAAMRETLRESDVLGRLGGEEFAAVLPNADEQAAVETAERVRTAVQSLHIALDDGDRLSFTVSIGIAALGERPVTLDGLIAEADKALYQAKASGRNRVVAHHLLPMLD